jgi:hypothetical protein
VEDSACQLGSAERRSRRPVAIAGVLPRLSDQSAVYHELSKVWKRVAGPPEEWDMGDFGTRKVVIFEDPDGIMLELIERPPYGIEINPVTQT